MAIAGAAGQWWHIDRCTSRHAASASHRNRRERLNRPMYSDAPIKNHPSTLVAVLMRSAAAGALARVTALALIAITSGCSVPVDRFASADRIDITFNRVHAGYGEPFASHLARVRAMTVPTCHDPEQVRKVSAIVGRYPDGWIEYWLVPPATPPLTLTFHAGDRWLGTLHLYPDALGGPGKRIHHIQPEEAVAILDAISARRRLPSSVPTPDIPAGR